MVGAWPDPSSLYKGCGLQDYTSAWSIQVCVYSEPQHLNTQHEAIAEERQQPNWDSKYRIYSQTDTFSYHKLYCNAHGYKNHIQKYIVKLHATFLPPLQKGKTGAWIAKVDKCLELNFKNVHYRTHSNLWNVLIIGTQDFNYLIRSNSWNEWTFEKTDHSNRSNWQFLLSFFFSCIIQLLTVYAWESSIRLDWGRLPSPSSRPVPE